ncbi:MAG TPA: hypothetical protein DCL54_11155, partial [Alphaproteobacteria bacterium]|nr:hypothetical protein [Alphaproteobacteria bacterium]
MKPFLAALICLVTASVVQAGSPQTEPRVIIGVHDLEPNTPLHTTYLASMAEFPLNHLGLELEAHNARAALPDLGHRQDVRGIMIWFAGAEKVRPEPFYDWVERAAAKGLPILVMGPLPGNDATPSTSPNRLLNAIGLHNRGGYRAIAYDLAPVLKDKDIVEFERGLPQPLIPLEMISATEPGARPHLVLQRNADTKAQTMAVVSTSKGAYVAPGYSHFEDRSGAWKAWIINPFALFRDTYRTQMLPMADTSTEMGRRIYYSHIDGDGWNSISEVDAYAKQGVPAAEVILRDVAMRFPDLPLTVAPIAADLDPDWVGNARAQDIARAFFALPHVEAGSHTYTHPFEWGFFGPGYTGSSELPFLKRYIKAKVDPKAHLDAKAANRKLIFPYDVPRAYGAIPFDINFEVSGSISYISQFLPAGKRLSIMQWSGDTLVFPEALNAAARANVLNINGRASRFDGDFPSYTNVMPVGERSGKNVRIYASHANENEYTALWQGRYFGFRYLVKSLQNTETPRRVKPANVYYHMYSGEKQASLRALLEVLNYVQAQEITPVTTSHYAAIARGFFAVSLVREGHLRWRIRDRGALNTLRFDDANAVQVDYEKSSGIVGHRHTQGSLYVTLDAAVQEPLIALINAVALVVRRPVLSHSRWRLTDAQHT